MVEAPGILAKWARFDARYPWVGDAVITAIVFGTNVSYYITSDEYRPTAAWIAIPFTLGLFLRRYATWLSLVLVLFGPPVIRFIDTGLLRDPVWNSGTPLFTIPVPFIDLICLGIVYYTVAARKPQRQSWSAIAAGVVITSGFTSLWDNNELVWRSILISALVTLSFALLGMNVRANRQATAALERRAEQLALERDQREQLAASQERSRIAREMHDVVAHSLSVMISLSDGALAALGRDPELARRAIAEVASTGRSALSDTRRLLGVLREDTEPLGEGVPGVEAETPAEFAPQPTEVSLKTLISQFRSTGLPVAFSESGPPLPDDAALRLAVYRIVQEALTNVLRYAADSSSIDVRVDRTHRDVVIAVENEAPQKANASLGSGKGLIGMRERVAVFDGTIETGPTATGWRVRATLQFGKG